MTTGLLVGHVRIQNVGRLPGSDFRWTIKAITITDGYWRPPVIADHDLRSGGVLPIGTPLLRGSHPFEVSADRHVYVYGRITYLDGFGERRFANFCHRYNTQVRETPPGGGYKIDETTGRQHDYGNDAN